MVHIFYIHMNIGPALEVRHVPVFRQSLTRSKLFSTVFLKCSLRGCSELIWQEMVFLERNIFLFKGTSNDIFFQQLLWIWIRHLLQLAVGKKRHV